MRRPPPRLAHEMPFMTDEEPLFPRYRDDTLPAFRLDALRRRYRRRLWDAFDSGTIRLEEASSCPCGGGNFRKIAEKDRFGFPFGTFICLDCGLMLLNPRIAEADLPRYYREFYHPLVLGTPPGETRPDLVREGQGDAIYDFVRGSLPDSDSPPLRVCEVGCASGSNLLRIRSRLEAEGRRCELFGTEYEEHYAAEARSRGIAAKAEGMEGLGAFGVRFDLVILSHLFEHLSDPAGALRQLAGLLSPRGLLFIEVPGLRNLSGYGYDILDYLVHAHLFHFDLSSLTALVERCGFRLIKGDETARGLFRPGTAASPRRNGAADLVDYLTRIESDPPGKPSALRRLARPVWRAFHRLERPILPRRNHFRKEG